GVVRRLGDKGAKEVAKRDRQVSAIAVSPDGTRAEMGWDDGSFVVWELALDREVESSRGSPPVALAFSADGRWIAQARADRRVALIDANTGKEAVAVEVKSVAASLAFSEDKLAVGLERGGVLLEVPGLREIGSLSGPNEPVRRLSFS